MELYLEELIGAAVVRPIKPRSVWMLDEDFRRGGHYPAVWWKAREKLRKPTSDTDFLASERS